VELFSFYWDYGMRVIAHCQFGRSSIEVAWETGMSRQSLHSTTLGKCLTVLETLSRSSRSLTYTDILDRTGLPKSTGYRVISILANERLVHFDAENRTYRIGYRLLELAAQGLNSIDLRAVAGPVIRAMGEATQESVLLAVRDGAEIVSIDRVESTRSVRSSTAVGNRAPLYCTGLGKAILAFLPREQQMRLYQTLDLHPFTGNTITTVEALEAELARVRERGVAIDDTEHQPDIRCVAAPVLGRDGIVAGAVSISAPSSRADRKNLEAWELLVREAAARISREIGGKVP
jgi:IclR family KDG regulon transcriptional repressor